MHVTKCHWHISLAKMSELSWIARVNRDLCRKFDKVSRYRRGKRDKVFTGSLAFIKVVGCDKHPLPFAVPAKQTKTH